MRALLSLFALGLMISNALAADKKVIAVYNSRSGLSGEFSAITIVAVDNSKSWRCRGSFSRLPDHDRTSEAEKKLECQSWDVTAAASSADLQFFTSTWLPVSESDGSGWQPMTYWTFDAGTGDVQYCALGLREKEMTRTLCIAAKVE